MSAVSSSPLPGPLKSCCHVKLHFLTGCPHLLPYQGVSGKRSHTKGSHACITLRPFSPYFVLYIEVYVIDKTWCKYKPNQTNDYAVNPGLIRSKTPAIKAVLTHGQLVSSKSVDHGCHQFQYSGMPVSPQKLYGRFLGCCSQHVHVKRYPLLIFLDPIQPIQQLQRLLLCIENAWAMIKGQELKMSD